jgi:DNA helicase-4
MATDRIRSGRYVHHYRYVIVDEYQDLSRSRFNLLKALRDSRDYRLFCVGDDWQSIYRFNGCDVSYILDFERYWGPSTICCIDKTYRFSGELLEKSSGFIRNSRNQFQKHLVGMSGRDSKVYPLSGRDDAEIRRCIADRLRKVPEGKSVLFLGRYNHDVMILDSEGFSWKPDLSNNSQIVMFSDRPDLEMRFMTIHSSKGLQADVVFSLNNRTGRYGFPSKRDEPVLIPLLLGKGGDQYDEERRLFYVAMTRAKDVAYIVTVLGHQSEFYRELFPLRVDGRDVPQMVCPLCGGTLVLRKGRYGTFYGCSNFGPKGCKFTRKFETSSE